MKKEGSHLILHFVMFILFISIMVILYLNITFSSDTKTIILYDEIVDYEIIDGDYVILHTENESYKVRLYDDVVDFTVNSRMVIELKQYLFRTWFWDDFEPSYDYYVIERIIKIPGE